MQKKIMARSPISMAKGPVAAGDSSEEFNQLLAIVSRSYEPCNAYELFLVSRMTAIHWRILRLEAHDTDKVSTGRAMLAARMKPQLDRTRQSRSSRAMPRGIGLEEINSVKLEKELYHLLQGLREEFRVSRSRLIAAAANLNENAGYVVSKLIVPQIPEKNESSEMVEGLAKSVASAE